MAIMCRPYSDQGRENWDKIFTKKEDVEESGIITKEAWESLDVWKFPQPQLHPLTAPDCQCDLCKAMKENNNV